MNRYFILLSKSVVLLIVFIWSGCDQKSIFSEQNDPEVGDSLFLGLYLGMEYDAFYDHCMALNKKQLVTQGGGGNGISVEYRMEAEFEEEVVMRFYPTFVENEIFEMPVTYNFAAWAPWNKQYQSDILLEKMIEKYKIWYGEEFKLLNHKVQGKVYYKIDGKRRINLFIKDDQYVQAVFTDLKTEKRLKEDYKKRLEEES